MKKFYPTILDIVSKSVIFVYLILVWGILLPFSVAILLDTWSMGTDRVVWIMVILWFGFLLYTMKWFLKKTIYEITSFRKTFFMIENDILTSEGYKIDDDTRMLISFEIPIKSIKRIICKKIIMIGDWSYHWNTFRETKDSWYRLILEMVNSKKIDVDTMKSSFWKWQIKNLYKFIKKTYPQLQHKDPKFFGENIYM